MRANITAGQYRVEDVFTPARPARATFVERDRVNNLLVDALRTPGMQIVVYGHSGSGKSTLLTNKLRQVYESHIVTRCTQSTTFDHLVLDAFDQLSPFYVSETGQKTKSNVTSSLSADFLGIKAKLGAATSGESSLKEERLLPPQLTPQALARFLASAKCAWVLEDFHRPAAPEKTKLSQVMKLFMDMSDEFPSLRIIAVGAVDSARLVVEYEPEMNHRVAEIRVPLMAQAELEAIITKGETLLNIHIPYRIKAPIVRYSGGLGAVCHQLSLNLCRAADIESTTADLVEISDEHLRRAMEMYLESESDTLKAAFNRAVVRKRLGQYDNCRLILRALSVLDEEGALFGQLLERIRVEHPQYPSGNLTQYLKELQLPARGCLLRYDYSSNKYSFSDPIFRVYSMAVFADGNHVEAGWDVENANMIRALEVLRGLLTASSRPIGSP